MATMRPGSFTPRSSATGARSMPSWPTRKDAALGDRPLLRAHRDGDEWIAPGPLGNARVRFVVDNEFGVVDHLVTLDNGARVHNALRVVPNGDGAEVMFTLLRQPGMTDAQFAEDAAWVEKDLAALKSILETGNHNQESGKDNGQQR